LYSYEKLLFFKDEVPLPAAYKERSFLNCNCEKYELSFSCSEFSLKIIVIHEFNSDNSLGRLEVIWKTQHVHKVVSVIPNVPQSRVLYGSGSFTTCGLRGGLLILCAMGII
jgi:hypothetical protein